MVKKRFSIRLDVKQSSSNRNIEVVEGDNGNEIEVFLTDDGEAVPLTDCRVLALFAVPGGRTVEQDSSGHGITLDDEITNRFLIELSPGSFAPGLVECEIEVLSGEGYQTLITSAKFNFSCRRSILNADTVLSTNEYPILVELLDRVTETESSLSSLNDAEKIRVESEQERATKEELRTAAEEARSGAEAARALAEQARVLAEECRSAAWGSVSAEAITLPPEENAAAEATLSEAGVNFVFSLPRGEKGAPGDNALPHAAQHAVGGTDAITPESIGAQPAGEYAFPSLSREAVLLSSAWEGSEPPYTQTVTVGGVTEEANAVIGLSASADAAAISSAAAALLHASGAADGQITVCAYGEKPEGNIPISILIVR